MNRRSNLWAELHPFRAMWEEQTADIVTKSFFTCLGFAAFGVIGYFLH